MTSASPTAASAAAIAMEKIATITPVGCAGSGLKRQKATKFMFAAASISSIPIRMKIAWRRLSAASKPMQNKAADKTRKMVSVGVIGLGSARVSRVGFGVAPKRTFLERRELGERNEKFAMAR